MDDRNATFYVFLFLAWALMPLMTVWLMLTHPGKCALIWKREITGTWFK